MSLFFDRCFGKRLPKALTTLKPPIELISYFDLFPDSQPGADQVPDDVLLHLAGSRGWLVVTQDNKWHHEAVHREAISQHNVGCVVFGGAQDPMWPIARLFMAKFDEILLLHREMPRPFLYHIDRSGKVKPRLLNLPPPASTDAAV